MGVCRGDGYSAYTRFRRLGVDRITDTKAITRGRLEQKRWTFVHLQLTLLNQICIHVHVQIYSCI